MDLPSFTIFTCKNCVRGKISTGKSPFAYHKQLLTNGDGWHKLPISDFPNTHNFQGQFYLNGEKTKARLGHHYSIFAGLPIWLAFLPGYFPAIYGWLKKRNATSN